MTFTPEQVETIVLEVIRRLGLLDTNPKRERGIANTADLTLNDMVVTMRLIEGRLAGVTRLVVTRQAVITPAVKDELKKHKVELLRQ